MAKVKKSGRIIDQYPAGSDPIVRGDDLTIPITFSFDITDWEWIAQTRPSPDDEAEIPFTVEADPDDPAHKLRLSLTSEQTALLHDGDGWDLQSTVPVVYTWVLCKALRVQKDYSRA